MSFQNTVYSASPLYTDTLVQFNIFRL